MYLTFSGKNKDCLTAIGTFRDSSGKKKYGITYIGKRIQDDIYFCKNDGYFRFNIETTEFYDAPEGFNTTPKKNNTSHINSILNFGDTYVLNEFMYKSGFIDVLKTFSKENFDTLMTLVLSYIINSRPNRQIESWYEGNIVKYLYPNAEVKSQRISEFLVRIGDVNNEIAFHRCYKNYLFELCKLDYNVLIDSTGIKNDICFFYTTFSNHNGKIQKELRLIFVSNISTGIPIFYKFIPGNVLDINSIKTLLSQLNELGINISKCILDAGYNSSENLDMFYDKDNNVKIEYVTRLKSNDRNLKNAISEFQDVIKSDQNIVKYGDRILYIKEKCVKVGKENDKPAFMYLCLDIKRQSDEMAKLITKASDDDLSLNEIHKKIMKSGFFALLSNKKYNINYVIRTYYERQSIEQTFDFAKNYTNLLPLRVHSEETLRGHLLLSYIAICVIKMIQLQLRQTKSFLSDKLCYLENQHCIIYTNSAVIEFPQKKASDIYKLLEIKIPSNFTIKDGKIRIEHCTKDIIPKWVKNINENGSIYTNCNENSESGLEEKKDSVEITKNETNQYDESRCEKRCSTSIDKDENDVQTNNQNSAIKRGPGRPKGSKNKKTLEREAVLAAQGITPADTPKRGRGRPLGSKNKKTLEREAVLAAQERTPDSGTSK